MALFSRVSMMLVLLAAWAIALFRRRDFPLKKRLSIVFSKKYMELSQMNTPAQSGLIKWRKKF
jgi:hypothetical protein